MKCSDKSTCFMTSGNSDQSDHVYPAAFEVGSRCESISADGAELGGIRCAEERQPAEERIVFEVSCSTKVEVRSIGFNPCHSSKSKCCCCDYPSFSSGWRYGTDDNSGSCRQPN